MLAFYQNYCTDSNQILHSDRYHQICVVGGPNVHTTNQDGGRPMTGQVRGRYTQQRTEPVLCGLTIGYILAEPDKYD